MDDDPVEAAELEVVPVLFSTEELKVDPVDIELDVDTVVSVPVDNTVLMVDAVKVELV